MDPYWLSMGGLLAYVLLIIYQPFGKQIDWLFNKIMPKDR